MRAALAALVPRSGFPPGGLAGGARPARLPRLHPDRAGRFGQGTFPTRRTGSRRCESTSASSTSSMRRRTRKRWLSRVGSGIGSRPSSRSRGFASVSRAARPGRGSRARSWRRPSPERRDRQSRGPVAELRPARLASPRAGDRGGAERALRAHLGASRRTRSGGSSPGSCSTAAAPRKRSSSSRPPRRWTPRVWTSRAWPWRRRDATRTRAAPFPRARARPGRSGPPLSSGDARAAREATRRRPGLVREGAAANPDAPGILTALGTALRGRRQRGPFRPGRGPSSSTRVSSTPSSTWRSWRAGGGARREARALTRSSAASPLRTLRRADRAGPEPADGHGQRRTDLTPRERPPARASPAIIFARGPAMLRDSSVAAPRRPPCSLPPALRPRSPSEDACVGHRRGGPRRGPRPGRGPRWPADPRTDRRGLRALR